VLRGRRELVAQRDHLSYFFLPLVRANKNGNRSEGCVQGPPRRRLWPARVGIPSPASRHFVQSPVPVAAQLRPVWIALLLLTTLGLTLAKLAPREGHRKHRTSCHRTEPRTELQNALVRSRCINRMAIEADPRVLEPLRDTGMTRVRGASHRNRGGASAHGPADDSRLQARCTGDWLGVPRGPCPEGMRPAAIPRRQTEQNDNGISGVCEQAEDTLRSPNVAPRVRRSPTVPRRRVSLAHEIVKETL